MEREGRSEKKKSSSVFTRQAVSAALCAALVLGAVFGQMTHARTAKAEVTGAGTEVDPYLVATWSDLHDKMQEGGFIRLSGDVKHGTGGGTNESSDMVVPAGKKVTLDLAGHVIDRGLKELPFNVDASANGYVIHVAGSLTLNDSAQNASHEPTIGYTSPVTGEDVTVNGGILTGGIGLFSSGVYVYGSAETCFVMNGGSIIDNGRPLEYTGGGTAPGGVAVSSGEFIMNGGMIAGNRSGGNGYAGGVDVSCWGVRFEMNGGKICDNIGRKLAGGVYARNNGCASIKGGEIINNTVGQAGICGGVLVDSISELSISGGTISGNHGLYQEGEGSVGAGGVLYNSSESTEVFKISGNPVITDNYMTMGDEEIVCNVYCREGDKFKISDALGSGAKIGIRTAVSPTIGSPVVFAEDPGSYSRPLNFLPDESGLEVVSEGTELSLRAVEPKAPTAGRDIPQIPPYTPEPGCMGETGWKEIAKKLSSLKEGGVTEVDMNGTSVLPLEAVESIKGKDITLVLDMGDGIKWTVNGKDLTGISKDIDLEVSLGVTSVPVSVINNLTGERKSVNFTLPADIGPGFRAVLTLPIGKEWEGAYANLFYYDRRQEKMEFISFCRIGEDGCAELEFGAGSGTGAADLTVALEEETDNCYTVVIDDHPLTPETEEEPANEPEQTGKPAVKLKGVSADGKITLSWNRVKGAEKYRVYQRVGGKYRLLKEYKSKRSLTLKKTLTAGKGKKALKVGKKYTFAVRAYVDGKWTKIGKDSKVTVKAEE